MKPRELPQPIPGEIEKVLHQAGIYALKPNDVARLFNVSAAAVYRSARSKRGIRAHRIGGGMRIFVKDVFRNTEEYQELVEATRRNGAQATERKA